MPVPATGEPELTWDTHVRVRVLQDIYQQASAAYWTRRAATFAAVGTPACDQIARACRNRAALGDVALVDFEDALADLIGGAE